MRNLRSKSRLEAVNSVEVDSVPAEEVSSVEKAAELVDAILKSVGKDEPTSDNSNVATEKRKLVVTSKPKSTIREKVKSGVRGMPKSGRPWKDVKQKFSTIKKSAHRRTFEKKQELRHDLKHIKELSKSIKEAKKTENAEKKIRRDENARKRLENERKNEIVQIIKNPAKLKRMKKKALRKIEKRDLTLGNGPKVV